MQRPPQDNALEDDAALGQCVNHLLLTEVPFFGALP